MNKKIKNLIREVYEAPKPDPRTKEQFLKTLPKPKIHMWQFLLTQMTFLRKCTLLLTILLPLSAFVAIDYFKPDTIWTVSSLIPFLALLAVTEGTRSTIYGMSELEKATRFSLKSITLARLSVWGILDFMILCLLVPLCGTDGSNTIFHTAIYVFVPYLLTANISLWITRHTQGRESLYGCMATAVLVSGVNAGTHLIAGFVYESTFFSWWLLIMVILTGDMGYEVYRTLKETEEYRWNLSLTD